MGLVPTANTYPQKLQKKMQASLNSKDSTTTFFVCFHFPICIKHKPDMETALSIVKHFKTELQQLNIWSIIRKIEHLSIK